MSSLAELPELVGFFSYSREDDDDSKGALSALRDRIQRELRGQLGRTRAQFRLWQDKAAIAHGTLWEEEIKSGIAQSVFFIPIITPTVVNSLHCKAEFELFLKREVELDRKDLIFPILYIRVPALENEDQRRQNDVLKIIDARQYADWTKIRQRDVTSFDVGQKIEEFCQDIAEALRKPWVTPQERRRIAEAEARQRADEERRFCTTTPQQNQRSGVGAQFLIFAPSAGINDPAIKCETASHFDPTPARSAPFSHFPD